MSRFLAALLLALCLPLWQAWAIGTPVALGNTSSSSGSATVLTTTANAPAGDTIIVAITYSTTTDGVTSVVDSASNTYVRDKTLAASSNVRGYVYRATNIANLPSGGTITVNRAAAQSTTLSAVSVSGLDNASPVDATGSATGSSTTPSASATTGNANDLVVGTVHWPTFTLTQPGGAWNNLVGNTTASAQVAWAYQIVSVTSTYTYNPTLNLSDTWVDMVVSYKAASSGGAPQRTLMGVGQ